VLDQFSATIEKIYAAAADASLWGEALRAIEDYTGSTGAVLDMVPKLPSAVPFTRAGSFSTDDCMEYALNYMWRCPRIAFAEAHPEIPVHYDRMVISEREMDRDATYEWFGKHGLRYYVAGWIGESSDHRAYMSLQRSRRQGHVEPEQVEQFSRIAKHMAQALALAARLGTVGQQCRFGLAFLDAIPHAVFALDDSGKVLLTNVRADELLRRGDSLVLFDGKLQCRQTSQQAQLDRLVRAALAPANGEPRGGWTRVSSASAQRTYVALVAHLAASEDSFGSFQPRALVVVSDPAGADAPDVQALRDVFGLTQTEARLASTLSTGHSLESAAASLNMRVATARSHLKAIFAKLEVNRQQDLVRLLTSLSPIRL
jgi:DNA-binding CsgD family transcriptional regulator